MARVAACIIGDEILNGKVQDANTYMLAGALFDAGHSLLKVETIGDNIGEIAATVRRLSESYDFVFTSGGIGPTHDDVTYEAISLGTQMDPVRIQWRLTLIQLAFNTTLYHDEETIELLNQVNQRRNIPLNDAAKRMALFPVGVRK